MKENYTINTSKAEELKNKIIEHIKSYEDQLLIIDIVKKHLKTKKDGSDFQNVKLTLNFEEAKQELKDKYNIKTYLNITDYDFDISFYDNKINNNAHYCYIKRRFYLDKLTPQQQEEVKTKYIISKEPYIRAHYYIQSKSDITKQIEKHTKAINDWLEEEKQKLSLFNYLMIAATDFIKALNENCKIKSGEDEKTAFYRDEIASIFGY